MRFFCIIGECGGGYHTDLAAHPSTSRRESRRGGEHEDGKLDPFRQLVGHLKYPIAHLFDILQRKIVSAAVHRLGHRIEREMITHRDTGEARPTAARCPE